MTHAGEYNPLTILAEELSERLGGRPIRIEAAEDKRATIVHIFDLESGDYMPAYTKVSDIKDKIEKLLVIPTIIMNHTVKETHRLYKTFADGWYHAHVRSVHAERHKMPMANVQIGEARAPRRPMLSKTERYKALWAQLVTVEELQNSLIEQMTDLWHELSTEEAQYLNQELKLNDAEERIHDGS